MTHALEATQPTDPEGSLFLPKDRELTLLELDKMKFAVMQLRGAGKNLTPDEQVRMYAEIMVAEEAIRERGSHLGGVALSLVV